MGLVYLYELDSVRKSEQEILIGQRALFEEIAVRGNQVVLSFNQLTDSRAFLCALDYKPYYDAIIKLIKNGSITFTAYYANGTKIVSSPIQYIVNALDKEINRNKKKEGFIFSALPVEYKNKQLLKYIRDAILYRDTNVVTKLIQIKEKRIKAVDVPDINASCINNVEVWELKSVLSYIKLLLAITEEPLECISPLKKDKNSANEPYVFSKYMDMILRDNELKTALTEYGVTEKVFQEALVLLKQVRNGLSTYNKDVDNRSAWLKRLEKFNTESGELAEVIVNLCYNYTIEASIKGVIGHASNLSFIERFRRRLVDYWKEYLQGYHVLHRKAEDIQFRKVKKCYLPKWTTAVRIVKMTQAPSSNIIVSKTTGISYEIYRKKSWIYRFIFLVCAFVWRLFIDAIKLLVAWGVAFYLSKLEIIFESTGVINVFLAVIFVELISYFLDKIPFINIPNIGNSFWDFLCWLKDVVVMVFCFKNRAYFDTNIMRKKRFYERRWVRLG